MHFDFGAVLLDTASRPW